jgi:hypothetical protein
VGRGKSTIAGFSLIAAACAAKPEPPRTTAPIASVTPTTSTSSGGDASARSPPAERIVEPVARTLDPRTRAAFGTILHLRDYARTMLKLDTKGQFTKNGCPTGIEWVTWGMAKTDPWDHGFKLRCMPGSNDPQIGSAGADGKWGTDDDLWTDHPIIDATRGCETACPKTKSCSSEKGATAIAERLCTDACTKDTTEINFYSDTCALLDRCDVVVPCMKSALDGKEAAVECTDFGRAASTALGKPKAEKALVKECERDLLRAHELVCVRDAKTARELALCFLTVHRENVEKILSAP